MKKVLLISAFGLLALSSCVIPVDPYGRPTQLPDRVPVPGGGYPAQLPDRFPVGGAQGRLTAHPQPYGIVVRENGVVKSQMRTAMPNVERYAFTRGNSQIIVKSRANHGPASVEMFDVETGILRDKVLSYAIRSSRASWAYGFED